MRELGGNWEPGTSARARHKGAGREVEPRWLLLLKHTDLKGEVKLNPCRTRH